MSLMMHFLMDFLIPFPYKSRRAFNALPYDFPDAFPTEIIYKDLMHLLRW